MRNDDACGEVNKPAYLDNRLYFLFSKLIPQVVPTTYPWHAIE